LLRWLQTIRVGTLQVASHAVRRLLTQVLAELNAVLERLGLRHLFGQPPPWRTRSPENGGGRGFLEGNLVKFPQRYQKSHRIFRNLLLLKNFWRFCSTRNGDLFSPAILGA